MFKVKYFEAIRTAAVIVIALIIAFLIISLVSDHPVKTIGIFLWEPLSTKGHIGNVIEMAIPLMFTGLAVSLLFRANMFNLGAEGIFYFSGVVTTALAIHLSLNSWFHPVVAILAGSIVGALLSAIPGILKAKWNANELVTSLMFNNILFGVGLYLLNYHLRDAKAFANVSFKFEKNGPAQQAVCGDADSHWTYYRAGAYSAGPSVPLPDQMGL
ncbi:hypothetical protein ACFTAO_40105 [Paenibacillus rhizoplanae]